MEKKYIYNNIEYKLNDFYSHLDFGDYILAKFNRRDKYNIYGIEGGNAIIFDGIKDFFSKQHFSADLEEYIMIQFNMGGKYRLYKIEGWIPIRFDGIEEFYFCETYSKSIKIQFNEGDEFKKYYYKDL